MDLESGIQMGKVPLTEGEADTVEVNTVHTGSPEGDDVYLEELPPWTKKEIFVAVMATGSVTMSILAMLVSANPFTTVTGVLGLILPPYSALQEQKITDCKAMRESNEVMQHELENLERENERLEIETEKLQGSVNRIEDIEEVMSEIKTMESTSLDHLENQLKASKNILAQTATCRISRFLDNIFDVMMAVDRDHTMTLSDSDVDDLIKRVHRIQNVTIHGDLFKKAIESNGNSIDAVFRMLNNCLDGNPATDPIQGHALIEFE